MEMEFVAKYGADEAQNVMQKKKEPKPHGPRPQHLGWLAVPHAARCAGVQDRLEGNQKLDWPNGRLPSGAKRSPKSYEVGLHAVLALLVLAVAGSHQPLPGPQKYVE